MDPLFLLLIAIGIVAWLIHDFGPESARRVESVKDFLASDNNEVVFSACRHEYLTDMRIPSSFCVVNEKGHANFKWEGYKLNVDVYLENNQCHQQVIIPKDHYLAQCIDDLSHGRFNTIDKNDIASNQYSTVSGHMTLEERFNMALKLIGNGVPARFYMLSIDRDLVEIIVPKEFNNYLVELKLMSD